MLAFSAPKHLLPSRKVPQVRFSENFEKLHRRNSAPSIFKSDRLLARPAAVILRIANRALIKEVGRFIAAGHHAAALEKNREQA